VTALRLAALLETVAAAPQALVREIGILSAAERAQVL